MKQVIIICRTCEDINKSRLGTTGFDVRDTEYESLTDAMEHLLSYEREDSPNHRMEMVVKE
jgi:hypothetical protein